MKMDKLFEIVELVNVETVEGCDCLDTFVKANIVLPCGSVVTEVLGDEILRGEVMVFWTRDNGFVSQAEVVDMLRKSIVLDVTVLPENDIVEGRDMLVRFANEDSFVVVMKSSKLFA